MTREQPEHVLSAAAAIASENSMVVVGIQAILVQFPNAPAALLASREVDLYPALHPERADLIDGAIGAMSSFDETFGDQADGVGPDTAVMPADWMKRASLRCFGEVTAVCPEVHDLAVSKVVAGRDKDTDFVCVLLKERMIDIDTLLDRIRCLCSAQHPIAHVLAWAQRRAEEAQA